MPTYCVANNRIMFIQIIGDDQQRRRVMAHSAIRTWVRIPPRVKKCRQLLLLPSDGYFYL